MEPLDEVRLKTKYETGDIQNLATLLADPNGKGLDGGILPHTSRTYVVRC